MVKYTFGAGFMSSFFEQVGGGKGSRDSEILEEMDSKSHNMNVALVSG